MISKEKMEEISSAYQYALETSSTTDDVPTNFIKALRKSNDAVESRCIGEYVSQIALGASERKNTREIANLIEDMIFVSQHLVLWYNENHHDKIYVSFSFRRKAIESELKKILTRIAKGEPSTIKDRFACRCIVCNNDDASNLDKEIKAIESMYTLINLLLDFFTGFSFKQREDFLSWVKKTYTYSSKEKARIVETSQINFLPIKAETPNNTEFDSKKHPEIYVPNSSGILDCYQKYVKSYTTTPKTNGYQSEHFVLQISSLDKTFPGLYIEFQIRTQCMHDRAEDDNGPMSHQKHKDQCNKISDAENNYSYYVDEIFDIKNWDNIHIIGVSKSSDLAGLRVPIIHCTRNLLF